jgi:hypothetical protein
MSFPQTLDELKAANYEFQNHSVCRDCGEEIEWYKTPSGKMLPFDRMDRGITPAVLHMKTCSEKV